MIVRLAPRVGMRAAWVVERSAVRTAGVRKREFMLGREVVVVVVS
jgi:hypothetical protein